jgi:hypothetical protein
MPRSRKPTPDIAPAPAAKPAAKPAPTPAPVKRGLSLPARKPEQRTTGLTRERLSEHLDAFHKAGGKIEVLGTTRALQRIDAPSEPASSEAAPSEPKKSAPAPRRKPFAS